MSHIRRPQNPTDPSHEILQMAHDLNLTSLAENLMPLLQQAEQENPSFSDFVRRLLQAEYQARKERRLKRILKRSNLGTVTGLEGFDWSARPKLDPRVLKELCNCHFVEQRRNILLFGRPGTGKTRIAKTLAHAACLADYTVLGVNTAAMLEELDASLVDNTFNRCFRRYTKPSVLLLDEFGYEAFTAKQTNYLFRIVSARYQQGTIILTANVGFSYWKKLFPSEAMAVATVDRLVDDATILRFTGKSFRAPREIIGDPLEEAWDDEWPLSYNPSNKPDQSFQF